jgi:prepilin-type N-terminal cleavage/methylation domain-containing protein
MGIRETHIYYHEARNQGFTLIELLIVVAIIGILAAISLVNYREAVQRAETTECMGNLRTLGMALSAYAVDYNAYPNADGYGEQNLTTEYGKGPAGNGYWSAVPMCLYDLGYVTNKKVFWCPTLYKRYPGRRQYLRYAMNGAALDKGGPFFKPGTNGNYWLAACMYVNSQWDTDNALPYPHGSDQDSENVLIHTGKVVTQKTPWYKSYDDPNVNE